MSWRQQWKPSKVPWLVSTKNESLQTEWIHREEMERQLKVQEKELKEEFNETISLNRRCIKMR
jgi:hypothetical protein